jgi:hypothetical protein
MNIQAQIPTALCAIHNFIRMHDPEETDEMLLETQPSIDSEDSDSQFPVMDMMRENTEASMRRDQIAQEMWEDYLQVLYDRGISDIVDPLDDDDFDDLYDNE